MAMQLTTAESMIILSALTEYVLCPGRPDDAIRIAAGIRDRVLTDILDRLPSNGDIAQHDILNRPSYDYGEEE